MCYLCFEFSKVDVEYLGGGLSTPFVSFGFKLSVSDMGLQEFSGRSVNSDCNECRRGL